MAGVGYCSSMDAPHGFGEGVPCGRGQESCRHHTPVDLTDSVEINKQRRLLCSVSLDGNDSQLCRLNATSMERLARIETILEQLRQEMRMFSELH